MPVTTIEKLEENRVFFDIYPAPGRGEVAEALTTEREQALALMAKLDWEKKHPDKTLVKFHKDPMAGGLRPHLQEGPEVMMAYPLWVAEVIVKQFKDDDEKAAWLAGQK